MKSSACPSTASALLRTHLTDQDLKDIGVPLGHRRNVRAQPDSSYCRSPPASARTRLVTFPRMCGQVHKIGLWERTFAPSAPGPPRGQGRPSADRRSAIGQTPKLCRGSHPTCQMSRTVLNRIIGHGGRYEYQRQCSVLASAWAVPLGSTKPCPWRVVATPSFAQRVGESRRLHVARYRLVAPRSRIRRIKAHLDELTNQGLQFGVVRLAPACRVLTQVRNGAPP